MKTMNNNQNHNSRPTTFAEELGSVIRRNSTIPQAVSGELRITNGDVEGIVTVNCSNAAYRDKLLKEAEPETSKDHEKMPVTSEKTLADLKDAPFAEKIGHDYYNRALKEKLETGEDVLVNTLTALQYLKKFERLEFTNSHVWINGDDCFGNIAHYLEKFEVDLDDAKAIAFQISDCMGLDIFKVIAKNKKVYIVAGNVETGVEIYDSSTGKNSKAFIMNVLAKK